MGFSFIKTGIILLIVGLLVSFATVSVSGLNESQDASVVQDVQIHLQKTITEASYRQGISAKTLAPANVVNAIKLYVPNSATLRTTGVESGPYELVFDQSGRRAIFFVTPEGDVRIKGLLGHWTRFRSVEGIISKH